MVEVLLALILVLVSALGFMGHRYFERVERHLQSLHSLISIVNVHEFAIHKLWPAVFHEPYPYSAGEHKR